MIQAVNVILAILAVIAGILFSLGLQLKFFKFLDYYVSPYRNKLVIRSFIFLVVYGILSRVFPRSSNTTTSGDPPAVPIDAEVEHVPGENSKAKE